MFVFCDFFILLYYRIFSGYVSMYKFYNKYVNVRNTCEPNIDRCKRRIHMNHIVDHVLYLVELKTEEVLFETSLICHHTDCHICGK